jgi:hypothetical protein
VRIGAPTRGIASAGPDGERLVAARTAPIGPAGATLTLRPSATETFVAPEAIAPVRITVDACSPDGTRAATLTLRPRLRGAPLRPMPRIVAATAVRHGRLVRVAVRTDRPLRGTLLAQVSNRATGAAVAGRGRQRFVLRLTAAATSPIPVLEISLMTSDGRTSPVRRVRVPR